MKSTKKRLLAMLLALCTLVTFAMPAVFAAGVGEGEEAETPASLTVSFGADFASAGLAKNAYLQSTDNWKAINDGYPDPYKWAFLVDSSNMPVNSSYPSRVFSDNLLLQMRTNSAAKEYTALKFVAPGTGDYALSVTFANSPSSPDASHFSAYILEMAEYTKSTIGGACTDALVTVEEGFQGTYTATAATALTEGDAYILVLCISGTAKQQYFELSGFSLEPAAEGSEPDDGGEGGEDAEDTREPVSYVFANPELNNQALLNLTAGFKTAYDAGEANWRYEAASTTYQFRDQNVHTGISGTGSNKYYGNNLQFYGAKNQWFALRLKSPGAGKYAMTLTGGTYSNGASVDIYFVEAAAIDEKLGENAAQYAEVMSREPYTAAETEAFTAVTTAIADAINGLAPDMTAEFVGGTATTGEVEFEENAEYVMVMKVTNQSGSVRILLNTLTATPVKAGSEVPEEPTDPSEPIEPPVYPEGPGYSEGTYDFYLGNLAGATLDEGKGAINAWYEAGTLNWNYYAKHASLNLAMTRYLSENNSMYAEAATNWWLAFKFKSPAQDGAYDIKMVHGLKGDGAPAGSVFVLPGDTATADLDKAMVKAGAAFTANWSTGEGSLKADVATGGETTTGNVSLRGGQEYIVVFMSTERCLATNSSNGSFLMGQMTLTRTGEYVEDEGGEDVDDGTIKYEFYDYDHPGDYINHYKTETELGKQILTEEIAAKYASGELNWTYQDSNGYGQFASGTPYLSVTVGETYYYVLKIKSPGTGTYEITYDHYVTSNAKAGLRGSIYILPVEAGMDFAAIRGEADFLNPVISTVYKAEKTEKKQVVGSYTGFQEGKEYFICFSVEDDDNTKVSSLYAYPVSLTMKRTGEYVPVDGEGGDYGTVYKLTVDDFIGKRFDTAGVQSTIANRYANGTMNWKFESGVGSAQFAAKYLQFGTGKAGAYWAIRIKSPGTGMYKVTLKNMLGTAVNAATHGEMYIFEAPEETIAGASIADYAAVNMPVTKFNATTGGTRFVRASQSGSYGFVEGKEYIVAFYAIDSSDYRNTTNSTYFYIDRLVMQRIGDYAEPEKAPHEGGIIAEDVVTEFRVGTQMTVTMNDHDYLVLCVYGGTMMIYDLDEWRLVDEVDISSVTDTPRTICVDDAGNWWITGASQSLYCYNPYTREGFNTGKVTGGGNNFEMVNGDDGYLYFGAYASTGLAIYKYDPVNLTHQHWIPESWAKYPGCVKQKGDYVYTAVSGDGSRYEIWKMNKNTGRIVDRIDISHMMDEERYVTYMSWLGDEYLMAVTPKGWCVVDIETMEMLSQEEVGLRGTLTRVTTEEVIDGKVYFVSNVEGLCYYDVETKTFGAVGGELANFKTGLRSNCYLTGIEDTRLSEKSLITFGGMSADGQNIFAINLETKSSVTLIGLVEPGFGEGMNAHTLFKGAPGSNEIIYGPMYPDYPARVFNIQTGELAREFMTAGQNDAYCYYQGKMYFGNYTGANLTRMDDGQATKLFTLNDENFHQSRIHSVCGGDNKVFVGTVPGNFDLGGVIAWYDMETELTYVVTGPNPEDVYYAKSSQASTALNKWYNAATGELVEDMSKEWDKDLDGDGVNQYFKGPIPLQSIIKVSYSDGLLYGLSCRRPGTGYAEPTHLSAQIFVYDVENMKMLKTVDLRDYIDGLPADPVRYITTLEVDPDISNKCWGVVCETLFSLVYDRDTNNIDIKTEVSYGLGITSQTASICTDMSFVGDYIYVLFGAKGGLRKINRYDVTDNTLIMGDFQRASQVPTCFVVGDDGDIYYVSQSSPHIYVLNVEVTEEELAEAQAVQDIIDALPDVITIADREQIFAAREAWEEMKPANQPFVNNYDKLEEAEIKLLEVRIEALGEITIEDEAELVSIRTTYTGLERSQRMKIDFMKVSQAESIMSILRGERTTNLIAALGTITLEKEQQVLDARASYMALTRYERTLVANEDVLNAAEAVLMGLRLSKNEAMAVDQKINEIGFVFFSDSKIKAAREAYDKLDNATKEWVENYDVLEKAENLLIAEYVIAVVLIVGIAAVVVVVLIKKSSKKKAKAE